VYGIGIAAVEQISLGLLSPASRPC
jgi:hypothetical protein